MIDWPLARWPHAAFILRLATHRARPDLSNVIGALIVAVGLAIGDARGYLRHVSLAIGLRLVLVAAPQAAWVLMRFESAGHIDLLRLSGASPAVTMKALFWGLVAPILSIGLLFLATGWALGAISNAEELTVLVMFEVITTATIGVLVGPRVLQRWAPQLLLTIVVAGAMANAIIAAGLSNPWNPVHMRSWPLVAAATALPLAWLLRSWLRMLHHSRQPSSKSRVARCAASCSIN